MQDSAFSPNLRLLGWALYGKYLTAQAGILFLSAGVICFFAYNWADMSHFTKFGLIAGLMVFCLVPTLLKGPDSFLSGSALLLCGLLAGPLMAVFGQFYQTGADAWELFRAWAVFLLLLALPARQAGLWVAFGLVAHCALGLYLEQNGLLRDADRYLGDSLLFLLPSLAFFLFWEAACTLEYQGRLPETFARFLFGPAGRRSLPGTLLPRLAGAGLLLLVSISSSTMILEGGRHYHSYGDPDAPQHLGALCHFLLLGFGAFWYNRMRPDTLMQSLGLFSLAWLVAVFIGRSIGDFLNAGGLLMIALIAVGVGAGIVALIKAIRKRGLELHRTARGRLPHGLRDLLHSPWVVTQRLAWGDLPEAAAPRPAAPAAPESAGAPDPAAPVDAQPATEELAGDATAAPAQVCAPTPAAPLPGEAEADDTPWYAKAFAALAAWIAAILLLGSLGFLLFKSINLDSPMAFLPFGLAGLGAARFLEAEGGVFRRQFALALGIAGSLACLGAFLEVLDHLEPAGFTGFALVVCLVSAAILRSRLFHALAAASAVGLLAATVGLSLDFGHYRYAYDYNEVRPFLPPGAMVAMLVAGIFFLALEWYRPQRFPFLAASAQDPPFPAHAPRPFLLGTLAGLLGLAIFATHFHRVDPLLMGLGVGAGLGLIFAAHHLVKAFALPPLRAVLAYALALAACAAGLWFPWLPLGLYAALFARAAGPSALNAAPVLSLIWCVSAEYYNTNMPLLYKSFLLMGTGGLLLLCALAAHRALRGTPPVESLLAHPEASHA